MNRLRDTLKQRTNRRGGDQCLFHTLHQCNLFGAGGTPSEAVLPFLKPENIMSEMATKRKYMKRGKNKI